MLIFIVPIFEQMFKSLGGKMPAITQVLITLSHNMGWIGPLFLSVAITGTVLFKRQVRRSESFRLSVDRTKLKLPVFGSLFRKLDRATMQKEARHHLSSLGLLTIQNINQTVETLSGGQRQGVALARAAAPLTRPRTPSAIGESSSV